ncbi:DUF2530 domain-containing protein [Propionibacteriaceae bacterium G57]|uniref:DUF2530 domain-containing protein n=1 Tax=Aestuariimicrobium sp. G57 TaxID=3418485 RepID=UPI003DA74EF7
MQPAETPDDATRATVEPRRRGLVQAPVAPLDEDGVQAAIIGTIAWAVGLVVMLLRGDAAPAWYTWTCVAGIGVGGLALVYLVRRRRVRRAQSTAQSNSTSSVSTVS